MAANSVGLAWADSHTETSQLQFAPLLKSTWKLL